MDKIDQLASGLLSSIDERDARKTSAYDTQAEIRNIKGNTAWVHIPGGVDETPVALTINANIGDQVMVRVSGGKAWIVGNASSPPTDDARANAAFGVATDASELSRIAGQAATEAQLSAMKAEKSANDAEEEAQRANTAANLAMSDLSLVERVVDVVNWIAQHGEYQHVDENETSPIEGKRYFTRTGTDPDYVYAMVVSVAEDDNPYANDWYEVKSLDEAITNFIDTHLVLLNDRMVLQNDVNNRMEFIPGTGVLDIWTGGRKVASYGSETVIGNPESIHIRISPGDSSQGIEAKLGFYDGAGSSNEVAYISQNKLYIPNAVIVDSLGVGDPLDGGAWEWVITDTKHLVLRWKLEG